MAENRIELSARVNVSNVEQLDRVADGYQNIRNESLETIRAQQEAERNAQRNMPGYNGASTTAGSSNLAATTNYNNARQLDMRLETITRVINALTDQLKESTEKGEARETYQLSGALNNAEQERQRLEAEKRRLENGGNGNGRDDSSVVDAIKRYGLANYFTKGLGYFNQITDIGFARRTAMANGDYLNADANMVEGYSNVAQGIGGSLMGFGMMNATNPLGWISMLLGGGLELGGAIGKYWAGDKKADAAEGEAYRKTLAGTNALNKRFADGGSWQDNSERTTRILTRSTELAEGTGLSRDDFLDLATKQSRFGAKSSEDAMQQARSVALWAQATGTDASLIGNFLGTARRYGDNSDVLGYASQARQAAGLTKAQNEEFLQSLQTVIEDGIANGYVKSTEDVSKTFVMFSRLSDNNPLWQGEQGAKRLSQMNNGIAGATALESVNDVIVMSAAKKVVDSGKADKYLGNRKTGTYIDEMLLMEQGTNPEMFGEIARSVQSMEGGNVAGQVERFKDIYKLNYAGAVDVYQMAQKLSRGEISEQSFADSITKMQKDARYQSEETKWQDAINRLDAQVALVGQSKFWENLQRIEDMIADYINRDNDKPSSTTEDNVTNAIAKNTGMTPEQVQRNIQTESEKIGYNYSEIASSNTNVEMLPIGEWLNANGAVSNAVSSKEKVEAMRALLSTGNIASYIDDGYNRDIYNNLLNTNMGKEPKDNVILEYMQRYGVTNPKDIHKVIAEIGAGAAGSGTKGGNEVYQSYYSSEAMDTFILKLMAMLSKMNFSLVE